MGKALKKIVLIIILLLTVLGGVYHFYKKYKSSYSEDAIVIKLSNLSVNFLNGNIFRSYLKEKEVSFSVTNNSSEDMFYSIKIINVKKLSKNTTVILNDKTSIKIAKDENIVSKGIKIAPEETQNYTLKVVNPKEEVNLFEIKISEEKEEEETITKSIIKNNDIKNSPLTKVGEELAVNDEGLISDLDDLGITYYYRGNVVNNYFEFADKMWRIVRINGDSSIRLILDENVESLTNYDTEYKEFEESTIYTSLNNWYKANLFKYDEYVYNNKYCYDNTLSTDGRTYTSVNRINIAKMPSYTCEGELLNLKIGLLSIDEAIYAGLLINAENKSNYLYNESIKDYWIMTPAIKEDGAFYPFVIKNEGSIIYNVDSKTSKTLRPVINLSPSLKVSGTGTKEDPYKIVKATTN